MKAIKNTIIGMMYSLTAVFTGALSIYMFIALHELKGWYVIFIFITAILSLIFCLCLCYGIGDTSNKKEKEGAE